MMAFLQSPGGCEMDRSAQEHETEYKHVDAWVWFTLERGSFEFRLFRFSVQQKKTSILVQEERVRHKQTDVEGRARGEARLGW